MSANRGVLALILITTLFTASCSNDRTALIVEFDIVGPAADRARHLEVLLSCEPSNGNQERMDYDLLLLGADAIPSLALEPGSPQCALYLAAQVRGEGTFPLAAADKYLSFEEGEVQYVTVTLDTGLCVDLDGDEAMGGAGCDDAGDCDELDASVHVDAVEICNRRDDDCNGEIDLNISDIALERACATQPVPWQPENGICRYWRPICQDGIMICPELDPFDDCHLQMDTNCDGKLTNCGCTPEMVDRFEGCEPCYEPACVGDDIECIQAGGDAPIGECCNSGGITGVYVCEPESAQVFCVPGEFSPEVCNDTDRADEDCDGSRNLDDSDCQYPIEPETVCPEVAIPRAATPNLDVPSGCDAQGFHAFAAGSCAIRDELTLELVHGIFIILYMDPFVIYSTPRLINCCNCHVELLPLLDVAILHVIGQDSRGRIYVEGDELIFQLDAWIGGWAVYEDIEVRVGIREGEPVSNYGDSVECISNCYDNSFADDWGGNG